jgi:hypothetical protein
MKSNGTKYIGIEFNQWKLHNLNLIDILAQKIQEGSESSYLNLAGKFYPNFGTLFPLRNKNNSYIRESLRHLQSELAIDVSEIQGFQWIPVGKAEKLFILDFAFNKSLTELKDFTFEGRNCGRSIFSTIFSDLKSTKSNDLLFRSRFFNLAIAWIEVYNSIDSFLSANHFDSLIIFNGRFVAENAAMEAATKNGIEVLFHESSSKPQSYTLENFNPFAITKTAHEVDSASRKATLGEVQQIATSWFDDRIYGRTIELIRYQEFWKDGNFELDTHQKIAVFFTTSDDEFVGLDENWNFGEFSTQYQACAKIMSYLKELGYFTVIRVHPNTKNKALAMQRQWNQLEFVDKVISASSGVNSYKLIIRADLIVVAGSTIGLESVFLERQTASVGTAIYDGLAILADLKGVRSANEVTYILSQFDLEKAKTKALNFAYWESTRTKFRLFLTPSVSPIFQDEHDISTLSFKSARICRFLRKKLRLYYDFTCFMLANIHNWTKYFAN